MGLLQVGQRDFAATMEQPITIRALYNFKRKNTIVILFGHAYQFVLPNFFMLCLYQVQIGELNRYLYRYGIILEENGAVF